MFEKEAEDYVMREDVITENDRVPFDNGYGFQTVSFENEVKKGFQDGAEFGYNKANEWHYVKDGKYPTDEKDVEVLYQDCDKINVYNCIYDTHNENWIYYNLDDMVLELFPFKVIAWKEIVLPKEIKENDIERT